MKITKNAQTVLEKRYLIRDAENKPVETVPQLFERVANAIAQADRQYDPKADVDQTARAFYQAMTNLEFLPNSPTLMNAGRPLGQLSACFVLPVEDSMEEIFEAVKQAALIHKSGGGTGFSFSRLRPKGSAVNSTGGVAVGPHQLYESVQHRHRGGEAGRHPAGRQHGHSASGPPGYSGVHRLARSDNGEITNFNISVAITEAFMEAALKGEDYDLVEPRTGRVAGQLNAREVFDKIVDAAWQQRRARHHVPRPAEPGQRGALPGPTSNPQTPAASSPCCPMNPATWAPSTWWTMVQTVRRQIPGGLGQAGPHGRTWPCHFLDNVIEVNKYPLPQIDQVTKKTRKVGLGVMGFADMLMLLGIAYNSAEGVEMGQRLMAFIQQHAKAAIPQTGGGARRFPPVRREHLPGRGAHPQRHRHHHRPHRAPCPSSPASPAAWSPCSPLLSSAT